MDAATRIVATIALLAAPMLAPSPARACATCGCGDPTLTSVGVEQPFAGRLRFSLALSHLSYAEGEARGRAEVLDQRATLGVAASPTEWLTLSAFLPVVWRETSLATLAHLTTLGVGDPELRARAVLFRDRAFAPEHLVSLQVGTRLPTPTRLRDGNGTLLPLDAQTGSGSFDPMLGIAWSWFGGELSMHASALLTIATEGTGGWRNGPSTRLTWQAQWQPLSELALVLGIDARIDADPELEGRALPGGGAVVFASPGVMVSPGGDVLLWLVARLPFVQALSGGRWEGPIVELGMAIDA